MESNEKAKGILEKLGAYFNELVNPAPVAPVAAEATEYKLEDGTSIMVSALEVGGEVKIADAPAPAGTHKLEDGTSIVLDEAGIILEVIAAEIPAADPAPTNPLDMEVAEIKTNFSAHVQAFDAYKESANQQFATLNGTIETQGGIIKQLFELITELTKEPAADPLPAAKAPSQFSKVGEKKKGFAKYAEAAKQIAEENKA